ncbi:MAG: RsmE family RNA methyltransferase [Oscillospiraceae bacterium]|nr:RsmE family RNA methyltransferase [Oscillospiraceae bacterium]
MPRFFDDTFSSAHPYLTGEHARHIGLSLRMRVGESVTVCANGTDYQCEIAHITPETVELQILSQATCAAEPTVGAVLYQALPKGDKLEQIVQKAVELGVSEIVPVLTKRCVARLTPKEFEKKRSRYEKIAQAAAMQSGRGMIPCIGALCTLEQAAKQMQQSDVAVVLYESEGGVRFSQIRADARRYALMIGSEGGFDPQEIGLLQQYGATPVWMGKRILRCETAPVAALAVLMHLTGNL